MEKLPENNNKKKLNFSCCKDNTIKSLQEVEYFLCNFSKILKSIKIYKFIKH